VDIDLPRKFGGFAEGVVFSASRSWSIRTWRFAGRFARGPTISRRQKTSPPLIGRRSRRFGSAPEAAQPKSEGVFQACFSREKGGGWAVGKSRFETFSWADARIVAGRDPFMAVNRRRTPRSGRVRSCARRRSDCGKGPREGCFWFRAVDCVRGTALPSGGPTRGVLQPFGQNQQTRRPLRRRARQCACSEAGETGKAEEK